MAKEPAAKPTIFLSYSHEDSKWRDLLLRHLRVLVRENLAHVWDVEEIAAGEDWSSAIAQAVRDADLAVLLLSPDFLASDFIAEKELPLLLERRADEGLAVLPILVRPTAWTRVKRLAEVQFLNDPSRPLSELSDVERDKVIAEIASRIAELAAAVRLKPRDAVSERLTFQPATDTETNGTIPQFFISHSRVDGDFAELLKLRMAQRGHSAWVDTDRLAPGLDWRIEIDEAIKHSLALVAVMSVEARTSEYVTYEWAYAWGAGVKIIPIMLRETPLHPRLATLQYLDFTNRIARPWDRLFSALDDATNDK